MNEQQPERTTPTEAVAQDQPVHSNELPESPARPHKTLAVRIDEELHTQLRFIADLAGTSIADEIRTAIQNRLTAARDDPQLIAHAEQVRQQIERDAAARSAAIAGFLGTPAVAATVSPPTDVTEGPARNRRSSRANEQTGGR